MLIFFPAANNKWAHVFNIQHDILIVLKGIKHRMHTKQHQHLYFDQRLSLRQFPF